MNHRLGIFFMFVAQNYKKREERERRKREEGEKKEREKRGEKIHKFKP